MAIQAKSTINPDKKGWERMDATPQQIALYKKLRKKLGYSNEGLYFLKVKQGGPSKLELSDKIDALLEEEKARGLYHGKKEDSAE